MEEITIKKYNTRKGFNKFGAKKCYALGILFDSQKEAHRYLYLKSEEAAGRIKNLELQPRFLLQEKFRYEGKAIRAIEYIADFMYIDSSSGKIIVEDTKGMKTTDYNIKKKIFLKKYGDQYTFREL